MQSWATLSTIVQALVVSRRLRGDLDQQVTPCHDRSHLRIRDLGRIVSPPKRNHRSPLSTLFEGSHLTACHSATLGAERQCAVWAKDLLVRMVHRHEIS